MQKFVYLSRSMIAFICLIVCLECTETSAQSVPVVVFKSGEKVSSFSIAKTEFVKKFGAQSNCSIESEISKGEFDDFDRLHHLIVERLFEEWKSTRKHKDKLYFSRVSTMLLSYDNYHIQFYPLKCNGQEKVHIRAGWFVSSDVKIPKSQPIAVWDGGGGFWSVNVNVGDFSFSKLLLNGLSSLPENER